ncbi:MAG: DUF4476 domain-containing protein [Bacteroidetes bacterium]|nr:DUF4476 domain-containing protein [Bacteroidota bacterium]
MFQKIKVLIYLLFCGLVVQSQNNSLVIFSETGHPFYLSVNHEKINKTAQSDIKVYNLSTGWNFIEIKIPGIIKELRFKDSILLSTKSKFLNNEFTYVLKEKDDKLSLQFKSVSKQSGPETPPVPEAPKETAPLVDNSIYGNLYKSVKNKPVFYNNFDSITGTCKTILTSKEINYALNLLHGVNDTETEYRYLSKIIDYNCLSVGQLKSLLELSSIDMDRLNLAKKAYTRITDKENINQILPVFKYPTMKESYMSFLKDEENKLKQKKLQCKVPADDQQFERVYTKIKTTAYENEKLTISKKLLVDVCLSSSQIKKIGELFTHDREKLEYMKYALNVLTDKENVVSLSDEFQFQGTKDEFLNYITHQQ